jgi:7,8-dihydropterin-6-yl-methyl-4-(beta-D-ribofuranosyl)aminobenzene 5'-phosphate synthase
MELTIVYDNEVYKKGIGLKSDWGFSCVIKTDSDTILFDTGGNGNLLLENMKILDVSPLDIEKIVISHEHDDHKGGLRSLLAYTKNVKVYQLENEIFRHNMESIIPEIPEKISENIWTTGRIKGIVDEQSLVIKSKKGWYLLTGCSHPGVDNILNIANQIGNIIGIIGGFHGFNKFNVIEDLEYICPCHCTVHKKDLKKAFPDKTTNCGVGKIIDFENVK